MIRMEGSLYNYEFEAFYIKIRPKDLNDKETYKSIDIYSNYPDEDFSVLEMGPEITKEVKFECKECIIENSGTYENVYLHMTSNSPGNDLRVRILDIKTRDLLFEIKDNILKYNR